MKSLLFSKCALGGILGTALAFVGTAAAGPRVSSSYAIATDVADQGGQRTTSPSYTHDGSAGGIAGRGTVATPAETARAGYIGQLFDAVGLALNSASPSVNERATVQLAAWQLLDDATLLAVAPGSVAWSVQSGPLVSIDANGLATAATVFQNSSATARGSLGTLSGTLPLTVLNVTTDDFGAYAGDGIDDSWQVQYFGLNNPNAAPGADPSGTGQTNLFKFVAGLDPLDPNARFRVVATPVAGMPAQKTLSFQPVAAGRTYTILTSPDLVTGTWTAAPGAVQISGSQGTFLDVNATGAKRFYEVRITKP